MSLKDLRFLSSIECDLFFCRYLAKNYDDRAFIQRNQISHVQRMEELCGASSVWRLPSNFSSEILKEVTENEQLLEKLCNSLKKVNVVCDSCELISDLMNEVGLNISFMNEEPMKHLNSSMRLTLDLTLRMLSCAIDARDAWSLTRLLSHLFPQILLQLCRRSRISFGELNIMSILTSYMNVQSEENECDLVIENNVNLKSLLETISSMTDSLHGTSSAQSILRDKNLSAVKIAQKYLKNVQYELCSVAYADVYPIIKQHLQQLSDNFDAMNEIFDNSYQKKSMANLEANLTVSLLDRFSSLSLSNFDLEMTPLLKSPKLPKTQECFAEPKEVTNSENLENSLSPEDTGFGSVANFVSMSVRKSESQSSMSKEDFYIANKENIPPGSLFDFDMNLKKSRSKGLAERNKSSLNRLEVKNRKEGQSFKKMSMKEVDGKQKNQSKITQFFNSSN